MGDIASGVASTLLEKLATEAYQEIVLAWGLGGEIEDLKDSMRIIRGYLIDAENKQFTEEGITEWLRQLKQAFYDASDILNEIECEANINEIMKTQGSVAEKVSRFFSCSNRLVFRIKMAHKIKDIREKIDKIASDKTRFGLTELRANDMTPNQNLSWRKTHSSPPSRVTGRDKEKKEIISLLLNNSPLQSQDKNIDVIPIVAMGGWGKTTLAQLVHNDERVKNHFDVKMWVHVSTDFDVTRLTSKILNAVDPANKGSDSLENLKSDLHKQLRGKIFLLILDDIWNKDAKKWHELRDILLGTIDERNKNESKIIVTTRDHRVASITRTVPEINLGLLPYEDCLTLFVKCAFQGELEAQGNPRLNEIGEKIVKKCKGVPLAVVTLGCLLNSECDEKEWKKILDSKKWELDHEKDGGILPALRLSYSYLPSYLKHCFSYCAAYPKGYLYDNLDLVSFWMAHGLLQPLKENEEPEYVGELYLKQLVSASFFQPDFEDKEEEEYRRVTGICYFRMHDLVHDLAMATMAGEIAVITSDSEYPHVNEKVRHLSISNNVDRVPSLPHKLTKVRTFRTHVVYENDRFTITEPFVKWISKEFKYLCVLSLSNSKLKVLPDCFGKMKHLKYLGLNDCHELEKLPNSICKLYNLHSLNLLGCTALQELPRNMHKLVSLRFLCITAKVTDLYSTDVRCFKYIQILIIARCSNLVVLPRDLRHLTTLKTLMIFDCERLARFEDEGEEGGKIIEVANDLSLQTFIISGLPQLKALPSWLETSAKTLQRMTIDETSLTALPEWLPKLTSLEILWIKDCSQLLSLPEDMTHLHNLQQLHILECPELAARYEKGKGPEWSKIAHIPNVRFKL